MDLHDLIWWFAGLAPGLLLGWWLGARKRPATTQAAATPTPQPQLPPEPRPEPIAPAAAPAAVPVTPAAPAPATAPAAPVAEPSAPAAPVWSPEVQALFDKGETIEAIKKIRATLGGPIARKVAREHLSEGEFRLPADIRKLADANKKLEAIRLLCDQTHMDMPLAQRLVEHYVAHPYR
ncbi:hypothetical protein AZ78_4601 [Lysobacter capsici AZ78]|uniref:Uncharacterized protein n=1 Tax=Lysobacter capsici AZ78 TaxID=1444315 RepID=A0A125MNM4_9GAMM|nr:hypothetical protein [Lysobacter capsici]KWS07041.1 hypothetical protein AZ78_4601 [Lysobacter capsici AZ78]